MDYFFLEDIQFPFSAVVPAFPNQTSFNCTDNIIPGRSIRYSCVTLQNGGLRYRGTTGLLWSPSVLVKQIEH